MSLRRTVAAAFRERGTEQLSESEFVVAVSLDRGWFSPDQAERLLDVAAGEGVVEYEAGEVVPAFDLDAVRIPEDFQPEESVLRKRSVFERVLAAITDEGHDKQEVVASINRLQNDLDVTIEAAAIVYARRQGVEVDGAARKARADLLEE